MFKRDLLTKASLGGALAAMTVAVMVPSYAAAQTAVPVPPPPAGDVDFDSRDPGPDADYDGMPDRAEGPDGYADDGYADAGPQHGQRPEDREYRRDMQRYDRDRAAYDYRNCVQESRGRTVAGAVIGGIAGAVIGSNAAPRWDRSGGAVVGGALGATAGAAIGGATGPVCPPGYGYGHGAYAYGPGYAPAYAYGPGYGYPGYAYGPAVVVGGPIYVGPRRFYRAPRYNWRRGYYGRRW